MATKSPRDHHTQWPNVASPSQLPNVSGATIQSSAVEVGDQCYSISDSTVYYCITATVGSAAWEVSTDTDAVHTNVDGELNSMPSEKTTPVSGDLLILEDSAASYAKKKVQVGNLPGGADPNAIHDNVSGEIAAVTEKASPISADLLLIEDSAATNAKKRVQIGNLPTGADPNAIHDNVAAEISAVTAKGSPTTSDYLLIEDAAAADAKKSITLGDFPGGVDPTAVHDDTAGEIAAVALKAAPVSADLLLIEDSAATNAKKRVTIGSLPTGADADAIHDNVSGEIAAVAAKATPVAADYLLIEDSAATNAKKSITLGDLPSKDGIDSSAIHDDTSGEIAAVTLKGTPVSADLLLIEDSAATNAKKRVTIGSLPTGADADAIHDNVSGEIAAIAEKTTPVSADLLVIEDSAATNAKKRLQIGNLPGDADAIHDNVAGEIAAVTLKGTPVSADILLIEDSADGPNNKKRVTIGSLPTGSDADAIHDNVAAEISAITAKGSPTTSDYLLIEDAAAADAKKSITLGDLPGGVDPTAIHDDTAGEIAAVTLKSTPVSADLLLIEDSAATNAKKRVTIGSLPTGADADAIHDNVSGEIAAITEKTTPVSADLIIIEDSAATNAKKRVQIGNLPSSGGGGGGETVAALNASTTMGASATEIKIGQTTYDGSSGASHTFKAIIEPSAAATCEIRLYDRGPVAGPATTAQLASKLTTSTANLQVLSLTLTASAAPTFPDNDEIYNTDRMYEIRAYISGTEGDVLYVGKVTLEGA